MTHFLGVNDGLGNSAVDWFECGGGGKDGGVQIASDPIRLDQGSSHGGSVVYG